MRRATTATFATLIVTGTLLAGCGAPPPGPNNPYASLEGYARDPTGTDATAWPDLEGVTLTILDNGAFQYTFDAVADQFKTLTGVTLKLEDGGDTVSAVSKLVQARKAATYDLVWGVDNVVYVRAADAGVLRAYKPELADRITPNLVFVDASDPWLATPVDHGYVALNIDQGSPVLNTTVETLNDVAHYADQFVTQNPATSGPGLAFLLATIGHFGENPPYTTANYDWREYWRDLLRGPDRDRDGESDGCVLVTNTWGEAYMQHYGLAGSWVGEGALRDKAIVTSYTTSPAIEAFFADASAPVELGSVLTAGRSTYHQIQTIAIVNGTKNLQAAQAFVEFTLTDFFQDKLPANDVMYPVVPGIDANATFKDKDPEPASFTATEFSLDDLSRRGTDARGKPGPTNLERWVQEWKDLYEDPDVNCRL